MVGAKPYGQLEYRDVDGVRMAYVSGIHFIREDSPDEIGTGREACTDGPSMAVKV